MLLSTKDQGLGRRRRSYSHGHVYSINKAARSSKLSLLSAITTQSSESNGSNSTVTQESYNKSKSEAGRRKKSSKRKKDLINVELSSMDPLEEAIAEDEEHQNEVDVFAFLVSDDDAQSDTQNQSSSLETQNESTEEDTSDQSLHFDSAIAMDDARPVTALQSPAPTRDNHNNMESSRSSHTAFEWNWPEVPKPKHSPIEPTSPDTSWDGVVRLSQSKIYGRHSPTAYPPTPDRSESSGQPVTGYHGLVALLQDPELESIPQVVRSFTRSSQRLLLELQHEVSVLDDELKRLDDHLHQTQAHVNASTTASSRRGSCEWYQHPTGLQATRADVSGRLQARMEQYYRLLILSQKIHALKPSSENNEHIEHFRTRIQNAEFLAHHEQESLLRLLSHEDDLLILSDSPNQHDKIDSSVSVYDRMGRVSLALSILLAIFCLQITNEFKMKVFLGMQIFGLVLALGLWLPRFTS